MLNIYLMRESIDKNKFIFEQTQNTDGSKVLIVPDQYTLESEKNALAYLKKSAIFDLEILSPTRLGYKILKETGKPTVYYKKISAILNITTNPPPNPVLSNC